MLLKKLVFDNYKTFYGHQEIDFYIPEKVRLEQHKNIILIGGLNGTGKTTVLKAIMYVLFGKRGISESEFKKLFSNVINNTFFDEGGRDCSVTLFIETDQKEEWELKISWSFDNYKRVIQENRDIVIKKPGAMHGQKTRIQNIEAFNRFIDRIIPYHAAPFFIFDGEEIKDIILRQNSQEMKDAIHKITGMETYKLFLKDLKSLEFKLQQELTKLSSNKKLDAIQLAINEEEEKIINYTEKLKIIEQEKTTLSNEISEIRKLRDEILVRNRGSRDKLIKEKATIESNYDLNLKTFKESFEKNAYLIILQEKIQTLISRLKKEKYDREEKLKLETSLSSYKYFMNELLSKPINPPLLNEQLEQINELGKKIWIKENHIEEKEDSIEEIHDVSPNEYNTLINLRHSDSGVFINLINNLEKMEGKISDIELQIQNAPDAVDISSENETLDQLHRELGKIEVKERSARIRLKNSLEEKKRLSNQHSRIKEQVVGLGDIEEKYDLVKRMAEAIEIFIEQITVIKAHFIRDEFSTILTKLFRKTEEFGKIEFDINTYTIKLFNDRGQEISIQDRSAGEMQMVSSSLIWALTKSSDLSLPMVIDTPLGRLDSIHRSHLINHYYKSLSDQVIILSTDTEITEEYINIMRESSHKQYMLDYDEKKKYTVIKDGYFEFVKL